MAVRRIKRWPIGDLQFPFGAAIFEGNLSAEDILSATPLELFDPNLNTVAH